MEDVLNELADLVQSAAHPSRISMIEEPDGPTADLSVKLDHGDTVAGPDDGMGSHSESFPIFAIFTVKKENWVDASRAAQVVKQAVVSKKSNWRAGAITREDGDGIYSLRLQVDVRRVYRP